MERHCFQLVEHLKLSSDVKEVNKIILGKNESKVHFFRKLKSRVNHFIDNNRDIDLIYLNDGLMVAFCVWLLDQKIPVVATMHGLDLVFPSNYYQRKIVPKMHQLSGVIAVSEATRQACIDRGFNPEKVISIPNGVDHYIATHQHDKNILEKIESQFNLNLKNKKILITLGRPVKRKGFVWFIENVMDHLPDDIVFLMVGPRSKTKSIAVRIAELFPEKTRHLLEVAFSISTEEWRLKQLVNARKNVVEVGKLPFNDVLSLLNISDAFVMPNIQVYGDAEGFGLVALEAALSETTVIASGIEGITDAIHDKKNGFLVPSGKKEAWIKKISEQINYVQSNKEFAQRAKDYTLKNFGWEKMTKGYLEYFKKIINEHDFNSKP